MLRFLTLTLVLVAAQGWAASTTEMARFVCVFDQTHGRIPMAPDEKFLNACVKTQLKVFTEAEIKADYDYKSSKVGESRTAKMPVYLEALRTEYLGKSNLNQQQIEELSKQIREDIVKGKQ